MEGGARIVATGRSDFANQLNNAVVFPSILRADIVSGLINYRIIMKNNRRFSF
ncbi:MAG: hypothetical protein WAM14_01920 [Candidatus Nitrosopolaris sp.]